MQIHAYSDAHLHLPTFLHVNKRTSAYVVKKKTYWRDVSIHARSDHPRPKFAQVSSRCNSVSHCVYSKLLRVGVPRKLRDGRNWC